MAFGQAPVHLEELAGPEGGLLSTRTRPDLDDQVLAVVGILRHQEPFEGDAKAGGALRGLRRLILEERHHLRIVLRRRELARVLGLAYRVEVLA